MDLPDLKSNKQHCLHANIRRATRAIARHYSEALSQTSVERTQFTLLSVIDGYGSVTISDLAKMMIMDQTTVTRNVQALQRKQFVDIKPGEDRRTRIISLSAEGKQALEEAAPHREAAQAHIVDELGSEKVAELLSLLDQIVEATSKKSENI